MQKDPKGSRPWYQEPWPWLLMAGPIIVVIAGFVTFGLAVKSDDGLVVDDYYQQGKEINKQLHRDEAAKALGLSAQVLFSPDMRQVRVITNSRQPLPAALELLLLHPAQDDFDQHIALKRTGDNVYQGSLKPASANHWYVHLQDQGKGWRLQGEWRTAEGQQVMLGTPSLTPVEN